MATELPIQENSSTGGKKHLSAEPTGRLSLVLLLDAYFILNKRFKWFFLAAVWESIVLITSWMLFPYNPVDTPPTFPGSIPSALTTACTTVLASVGYGVSLLVTLRILRGQDLSWRHILKDLKRNWLQGIVAALIVATLSAIGYELYWVPGLVVFALFLLVLPLVIDRGLSPSVSMALSIKVSLPFLLMQLFLTTIAIFLSVAGAIFLYIGLVTTVSYLAIVNALVYHHLSPQIDRRLVGIEVEARASHTPE